MKLSSFLLLSAALFVAAVGVASAQTLTVSTLAGSPRSASEINGPALSARFSGPYGIAVAGSGDLYVADHGGGVVRKISGGVVTTLGTKFFSPYGVAADAAGNVYVTDTLSFVVDRVAPDGSVTVFAGSGNRGTADGAGASAQFSGPTGIAVDGSGNVYVADTNRDSGGAALRKIAADGSVTTLASGFVDLRGVAVGGSGTIYVADAGDNTIRTVAADGTTALLAGIPARTGADDGAAISARFNLPSALAVDGQGNIFVADYGNSTIREITQAGQVSTVAGLAVVVGSTDGAGTNARFYSPAGIATDGKGTLFIADTGNDTIRSATGVAPGSTISQTSVPATAPASSASLINLSVRASVGSGSDTLVVGFVTSGSGAKHLLIRGIGPGLTQFGVTGALAQPQLALFSSTGSTLASNDGWDGSAAMTQTMAQVGAFALAAGSADAAMTASLTSGAYTAQISGAGGSSGVALAEVYDTDGASATSHLINISSRATVGAGASGALVVGFVVSGNGSEKVLIRGIGPTLASFGVSGVLAAPQLTVFDAKGNTMATQAAWGGDASVAATASAVGAFTLPANSADSALVLTLPAGAYTAQVTGQNGATGVALVEVYAVSQ